MDPDEIIQFLNYLRNPLLAMVLLFLLQHSFHKMGIAFESALSTPFIWGMGAQGLCSIFTFFICEYGSMNSNSR